MVRIAGAVVVAAVIAAGVAPAAAPTTQRGNAAQGAKVYAAQKCDTCHVIGDVGGKLGPELTSIGTKRTATWLEKYLLDPRAFNPDGKMPLQAVKGQELKDLVAYLVTLKGRKK